MERGKAVNAGSPVWKGLVRGICLSLGNVVDGRGIVVPQPHHGSFRETNAVDAKCGGSTIPDNGEWDCSAAMAQREWASHGVRGLFALIGGLEGEPLVPMAVG